MGLGLGLLLLGEQEFGGVAAEGAVDVAALDFGAGEVGDGFGLGGFVGVFEGVFELAELEQFLGYFLLLGFVELGLV